MSNVKDWGVFLSKLNSEGKINRVVVQPKPNIDFSLPKPTVLFNIAIAKSRQEDHFLIKKMVDDEGYTIGLNTEKEIATSTTTVSSILIDCEYFAIKTTKGNIYEMVQECKREYSGKNLMPLIDGFLPPYESRQEEISAFQKVVSTTNKYRAIIRDSAGYRDIYKGDKICDDIIGCQYFALFSKSDKLIEFVTLGSRKIKDNMDAPEIYLNPKPKIESESSSISASVENMDDIANIVETTNDPVKKDAVVEVQDTKKLTQDSLEQLGDYFYSMKTQGRLNNFQTVIHNAMKTEGTFVLGIDGYYSYTKHIGDNHLRADLIRHDYVGIIDTNNKLYEYKKVDVRPINKNMIANIFAKDIPASFKSDHEDVRFNHMLEIALSRNETIIFKKPGCGYYVDIDSKTRLIDLVLNSPYIGFIENNNSIHEYYRIGIRPVSNDMTLPAAL